MMDLNGGMSMQLALECLLRIFLAALCGLFIGLERRTRMKEAGIRTHLIVAVGAALMTVVSKYGFLDMAVYGDAFKVDASRIAAQIVSGVGFLGAGMIFMRHQTLTGLTTAAGVWTTAGIGMAMGSGLYMIALFATVLIILIQVLMHNDYRWTKLAGSATVVLRTGPDTTELQRILGLLQQLEVQVLNLEVAQKKESIRYEFFLKLPPGLSQNELGEELLDLGNITYVNL